MRKLRLVCVVCSGLKRTRAEEQLYIQDVTPQQVCLSTYGDTHSSVQTDRMSTWKRSIQAAWSAIVSCSSQWEWRLACIPQSTCYGEEWEIKHARFTESASARLPFNAPVTITHHQTLHNPSNTNPDLTHFSPLEARLRSELTFIFLTKCWKLVDTWNQCFFF